MSTKKLISETTIPVRWTDMDVYQHVNNASYFDYLTEARHDLLIKPYISDQQENFLLVDVSCEFKRPVTYPDIIQAKQYIEQLGNTSFVLSCDFFNKKNELCATGKSTLVTVVKNNLTKPIAIPDYIKEIFGDDIPAKQIASEFHADETKLISTKLIPLRWVDMDAFNHVNNARYFDFMVEARNALFPKSDIRNKLCLFFLANSRCTFHKALYYPGNILVKQYLLQVGGSSFTFGYQFLREEEPDIYAEGSVTLVCVDIETKKPIRVAQQLLDELLKK